MCNVTGLYKHENGPKESKFVETNGSKQWPLVLNEGTFRVYVSDTKPRQKLGGSKFWLKHCASSSKS